MYTVCCSLSNAEHVLALAVRQLLGNHYNVTVNVDKGNSGYSEQVCLCHSLLGFGDFCSADTLHARQLRADNCSR